MKNVRIFYTKTGRMKFVSHLDMNRLIPRIIRRSGLPVWYTEGFNRHIYINYAVPLSLGFEGFYEVMDIRLTDDAFPPDELIRRLSAASVPGLTFLRAAAPVHETKDIAFAEYRLLFEEIDPTFFDDLRQFLMRESILVTKKGKKGKLRELDLAPLIRKSEVRDGLVTLTLSAGNENNVNPTLVMNAFFEQSGRSPVFYRVERHLLLDGDGNPFI